MKDEIKKTNYNTFTYRTNEWFDRPPLHEQSMTDIEWKYDEATGELVEVGKINVSAKVNSYKSFALESILDKYLDAMDLDPNMFTNIESADDVVDVRHFDLSDLGLMTEQANRYRKEFNLDPTWDAATIFRHVADEAVKKQNDIENYVKGKVLDNGNEKGKVTDNGNAQEIKQESK